MSKLGPVSLRAFVARMKKFGFEGPYQEGTPPYMIRDPMTLTIPNPHDGDISQDLLTRLLRQAGITRAQWMNKK